MSTGFSTKRTSTTSSSNTFRSAAATDSQRGGLVHLLAMLREEGAIPQVVSDKPPYDELLEEHCAF